MKDAVRGICLTVLALFHFGCATPKPVPELIETPGALPVNAGFVFQETIHAVGLKFSLEDFYWKHTFPTAATAFESSRRYASLDAAEREGHDLIVIAKTVAHGGQKQFKFGIKIEIRDRKDRLVSEVAYSDKSATPKTAPGFFEAAGTQFKEHFLRTLKVRKNRS